MPANVIPTEVRERFWLCNEKQSHGPKSLPQPVSGLNKQERRESERKTLALLLKEVMHRLVERVLSPS